MAGEEAVEGNNKRKFSSSTSAAQDKRLSAQDKHSSLPSQDKQRRNSCPREPIWVEIETLDKDDETTFRCAGDLEPTCYSANCAL